MEGELLPPRKWLRERLLRLWRKYIELVFVQVSNKEPNIKKTLVNIKPKKEDNADMVVVMEEDVDDEEEEEDFLGGRRIEERRPAEVGFLSPKNDSLNISPKR